MRPEDVGFHADRPGAGQAQRPRAPWPIGPRRWATTLTGEQLQTVFDEFKKLADKKKEIYDGDIIALIEQQIHGAPAEAEWKLVAFEVASGSGHKPRAKLTLRRGDKEFTEEVADGDGPIDAAFLATEKITGIKLRCIDYHVQQRHARPRRPGRSEPLRRARQPNLPRPRRLDRYGGSDGAGDS